MSSPKPHILYKIYGLAEEKYHLGIMVLSRMVILRRVATELILGDISPVVTKRMNHTFFISTRPAPGVSSFADISPRTSQSTTLTPLLLRRLQSSRTVNLPPTRTSTSPPIQIPSRFPGATAIGPNGDSDCLYPLWTPPTRGILSKLPAAWVPFAELSRIEKPGGLYGFYMAYLIGLGYGACFVAIPTTTAISFASLGTTAGILLVYNVFLRGAACTVNDILDRDYDRQVARCRNRPVARGAVSIAQAYAWYAAQTVGAAGAIACLPDPMLAFTYAAPIHIAISLYPLSKRFTDFPQLILSAPIAGGVLMAAAIVGADSLAVPTLILALSHYIWTTIFDYVNACQDTTDDIRAGVRSMAVRFRNTETFIASLGLLQVMCLVVTGMMAGFSPVYFVGAAGGNALWIAAMVKTVKRSRPDICAWWFAWGGLLVSGTTVLALFAEFSLGRRAK
ncbi:hypothetical protein M434DRAFT_401325 [Hypoxylon sp. CO27-5]|nr:hypothetical protein M434DRAFT_401325 [Hypoxylon sp. CO27-5]